MTVKKSPTKCEMRDVFSVCIDSKMLLLGDEMMN